MELAERILTYLSNLEWLQENTKIHDVFDNDDDDDTKITLSLCKLKCCE